MKIDEIIKQAEMCSLTLNSCCVECNEKAKDFYKSVIENLEVLEILKPFLKIEETGDVLFPFELSIKSQYVSNRSSLYINVDAYEKIKKWLQANE